MDLFFIQHSYYFKGYYSRYVVFETDDSFLLIKHCVLRLSFFRIHEILIKICIPGRDQTCLAPTCRHDSEKKNNDSRLPYIANKRHILS